MTRRSAAIVGKTPEALFWGLGHPCSVRRRGIPERNQASGIFQDLRSLRELDLAIEQSRVVDGIALHPQALECEPAESLGFLIDEVIQAYGGPQIEQVCGSCPANFLQVARTENGQGSRMASCFGVLPINNPAEHPLIVAVDARLQKADPPANRISANIASSDRPALDLSETNPTWYGLWKQSPIHGDRLAALLDLFRSLNLEWTESESNPAPANETLIGRSWTAAWREFLLGLEVADRSKIPVHVEYIPAGFSDGVHWRIFAHCQICKFSCGPERSVRNQCPGCGVPGFVQAERTRKVLGLRPYLLLEKIIGPIRTNEVREAARRQFAENPRGTEPSGSSGA